MNWRNLIAAYTAMTIFGFAMGISYPLLSLLLEADGISTRMIGINAAMGPIGILLFSPLLPRLSRRYGSRRIAICAALITAGLILCYKLFPTLEAWFLIRLLQGMSVASLFVLSEAWVVQYAGDIHRAKVVALYSAVLSASFAAGPALVSWVGIHGWFPFGFGSAVVLLSVLPLTMLQDDTTPRAKESPASGILSFATRAPVLLAAVAVFAIFDAATLSFIPVYGLQNGMDISQAALALTALIVGNVVLQFPIGWLADRYSRRAILTACTLLTILFALLLPYARASVWIWPVLVLLGASAYGIYTVSLADLGDRFKGNELVTGTSAFAVMWGLGALFGSVSGGWSMSLFGPDGLPTFLAAAYALLLVIILLRGRS